MVPNCYPTILGFGGKHVENNRLQLMMMGGKRLVSTFFCTKPRLFIYFRKVKALNSSKFSHFKESL